MTETTHTRSRRAALGGLILQVVAFGVLLGLSYASHSVAIGQLSAYVLGGVAIWFVALLVYRQQELAALEALDLEELRRERMAAGAGEGLFDESGGGFRVAQARLRWMQQWLVPAFGLLTALYLGLAGGFGWYQLARGKLEVGSPTWPELADQGATIAMVVLAILMVGLFLYSRYTSGMGRVPEWQLLRGCGAYMLGNVLAIMAVLVALGAYHSAQIRTWEQVLAYVFPIAMLVLALETLINFVLDIYRPRSPAIEPRAAFDSRLLGLIAEPGGIASSIADAMNYQFGFQVSQTWFYQLLERAFLPLVATGALALWALTCIVVVQPPEHVIIERFGRQLDAEDPLGPGFHLKLPWPIDKARTYNTGQLHEIHIGFKNPDAQPAAEEATTVQLWTDEKHLGQDHFDFLICPVRHGSTPGPATAPAIQTVRQDSALPSSTRDAEAEDTPVNLIRMDVIVQYRVRPDKLHLYTRSMRDPQQALRDIAWTELGRFTASSTVDRLLGEQLPQLGELLRQRMTRQIEALQLGLEIVYVGVRNVHPERTVAEAYRYVVRAEQQKVAAIRKAIVEENERLSKVAGDARTARVLADAIAQARGAGTALDAALQELAGVNDARVEEYLAKLAAHAPLMRACVEAVAGLEQDRAALDQMEQDYELGLGRTLEERKRALAAVKAAEQRLAAARSAADAVLDPIRDEAARQLGETHADALVRAAAARVATEYWEALADAGMTPQQLEGQAAATLAQAMAQRWQREMEAARQVTQLTSEREAYRVAPRIYQTRQLLETLTAGLKDARKYLLGFEPQGRTVRVRLLTDDDLQLRPEELSPDRSVQ